MVSSKWIQVESPSPFRFLAALMPPCAHTECERFTGTMENRSTSPPISAILMTAARPARPPPTTIIFGVAAMLYESDLPGPQGLKPAVLLTLSGTAEAVPFPEPLRSEEHTSDLQSPCNLRCRPLLRK